MTAVWLKELGERGMYPLAKTLENFWGTRRVIIEDLTSRQASFQAGPFQCKVMLCDMCRMWLPIAVLTF